MASQKVVLYTCIFGDIDKPKSIKFRNNFDYILFTDQKDIKVRGWDVVYIPQNNLISNIKLARFYKHHPIQLFPNHKTSVWLDATHYQIGSIESLIDQSDISAMQHFSNKTLKQELNLCIQLKKDDEQVMSKQVERYYQNGYVDQNQFFCTTCLIRRHSQVIYEFQEMWWNEIDKFSIRDQLSFSYCLWKKNISCSTIPGFCRRLPHLQNDNYSEYFKIVPHGKTEILL